MPQYTLLTIVTDMLVKIKSEGVESVESGQTTEDALMCVNLVNVEYEGLLNQYKWRHLRSYKPLVAGTYLNTLKGDTNDTYVDGRNIYYGEIDDEHCVKYVDPEEFIRRTIGRTSTDSNVDVINNIKVRNDIDPTYYTSFDDTELVFDAMPTGAGLVASDSKALVYTHPSERITTDAGTFNLPKQLQPYFRDLCIAVALETLADEDTKADKLKRTAIKNINKIAYAGKFVDRDEDVFKHIKVRNGNFSYPRNVVLE